MLTINNYYSVPFFYLISLTLTLIFFLNLKLISKQLNIFDQSDNERKFHISKIPPIGGIIFFSIFTTYIVFIFFFYESKFLLYNKQILSLLFCCTLIFLTGLIDDKINLSSKRKTIIFIILILISIFNDDSLIIYFIRSLTFNKTFALGDISVFFTVFCFFVFINAFNMFDGINLQSGLYSTVIFGFFIYKGIEIILFIPFFFTSIIFLYYNFKNKIFLGNCGSYFLSFLISVFLIKSNIKLSIISVEEILILMIIPGLDLIRLFCKRILNGKSPFNADRNHIHHLLLKKIGNLNSVILIFCITLFPIIISQFFNNVIIILMQSFIYIALINYSKENILSKSN